ncbi:MAG TPA: DUF488 domain-containing protein [Paracoccaceae bacterium]|nr:DUF488 domain-containing protein [Paracoccaceae bacterium]
MARFSTIGHSTRTFETFATILQTAGVEVVADVRSFPRSRSNPTYNIDGLPDLLSERQVGYRHMPALGGRRGRQAGVPAEVNAVWRNDSFHNYADYALSDEFAAALADLVALGCQRHVAIMCAEAVWWRCHRRIIADHLIFAGHEVVHLMEPGREAVARPTPGACRTKDGLVVYPASPA